MRTGIHMIHSMRRRRAALELEGGKHEEEDGGAVGEDQQAPEEPFKVAPPRVVESMRAEPIIQCVLHLAPSRPPSCLSQTALWRGQVMWSGRNGTPAISGGRRRDMR